MRITQNPDEIILRYIPVRAFIFGGGLVFIIGVWFLWLLYALLSGAGVLPKLLSGSLLEFIPAAILGGVFLLALYWFVRVPVVTVTLSGKTKSVDAHFRRIFGSETVRFYFTQIHFFKAHKGAADYSIKYQLALVLENSKEFDLKFVIGKDKHEAAKLSKKLNKFIRPPKPSQKAAKKQPR